MLSDLTIIKKVIWGKYEKGGIESHLKRSGIRFFHLPAMEKSLDFTSIKFIGLVYSSNVH